MKGELEKADQLLHQALRLSHQSENTKAIVYTYSMVSRQGRGWPSHPSVGQAWDMSAAAPLEAVAMVEL